MRRIKIPIIITSCLLVMVVLIGYVYFSKNTPNNNIPPIHKDLGTVEASTVSPGAISKPVESSANYTYIPPTYEYDDNNEDDEDDNMTNNEPTKAPWTPATEIDLNAKSITVYVNKEYCLPKNYVPDNLVVPNIKFDAAGNSERKHMRYEAAQAIEVLFAAALEDGYELYGISGYRSYERQKEIFLNNIVHKGKKHTLKYSAVPGTSEHQTGLAMDVSCKRIRYKLVASFAKCDEGIWLAENAHKFGFIIRYPKNQYEITGYAYEPWHIRYVGEDLADYLYTSNLTLDEYYDYTPSEGFDFEELYAELINYKPPITPTPIPEDELEEPTPLDELPIDGLEDEDLDDDEDGDEDLEDVDLEEYEDGDEDFEDHANGNEELEDNSNENEELEDGESVDQTLDDNESELKNPDKENIGDAPGDETPKNEDPKDENSVNDAMNVNGSELNAPADEN